MNIVKNTLQAEGETKALLWPELSKNHSNPQLCDETWRCIRSQVKKLSMNQEQCYIINKESLLSSMIAYLNSRNVNFAKTGKHSHPELSDECRRYDPLKCQPTGGSVVAMGTFVRLFLAITCKLTVGRQIFCHI